VIARDVTRTASGFQHGKVEKSKNANQKTFHSNRRTKIRIGPQYEYRCIRVQQAREAISRGPIDPRALSVTKECCAPTYGRPIPEIPNAQTSSTNEFPNAEKTAAWLRQ
jgi:hypothetical protein